MDSETIVGFLKDSGAKPFIVPAMGSHGGARRNHCGGTYQAPYSIPGTLSERPDENDGDWPGEAVWSLRVPC